jgi:N-methylhydantoinase A
MRFVGQQHSVKIALQTDDAGLLMGSFVETYRNRYGHAIDGSEAEIVALHCSGIVRTARPNIARLAGTLDAAPAAPSFRPVYYTEANDFLETPVFQRSSLPIGFSHEGHAVIEEYGSTTIVGPKDSFSIGPLGEIRIRVGHSGWATT